MATKTTGTRKYLIWGSVLVLAGIGGYIIFKRRKDAKAKDECSKNGGTWDEATKTCTLAPKVEEVKQPPVNNPANNNVVSAPVVTYAATGLSQTDGDAFRAWVNTKYPDYAKKIDLSKTGAPDNNYIRQAFATYGTEWKNSKSGKITILPTNADSFTKLAASLGSPVYVLGDGRRYTVKKFTIVDAGQFSEPLIFGTWKIELFEQASADPSKQSFRITTPFVEFNNGYWGNNAKSLYVQNGTNKGTQSTTDAVYKTIEAVVGRKIKWA